MANILKNRKSLPKKTLDEYAEDALYREVWEEVNTQKMYIFLKKYSKHLIAGSIVILAIVIGIQISNYSHKKSITEFSTRYEMALANNDFNELNRLAVRTKSGMGDLAAFKSYLINRDVKTLEKLAENGATRDFRDLARIHLAGINGDKMTAGEFEKFMRPLDTKKSPFYYRASLLVAQKYLSADDKESAKEFLDKIDSDAPNIISATATSLR